MNAAVDNTIRVKITATNACIRWPCVVCGGVTDKDDLVAEVWEPGEEEYSGMVCGGVTDKDDLVAEVWEPGEEEYSGMVCEACLERGADAIPATLRGQAERLVARAAELRRAAEAPWELPTIEEWKAARAESEARWADELRELHEAPVPGNAEALPF